LRIYIALVIRRSHMRASEGLVKHAGKFNRGRFRKFKWMSFHNSHK